MQSMWLNKLLICPITDPGEWYIFDPEWNCIGHESYHTTGAEFDTFLPTLEWFIEKYNLRLESFDRIYLTTGPASFTGGRITTLTLGSLSLVYPNLELVWITLFEYWEAAGNQYPMAIEANSAELVVQLGPNQQMELVQKAEYANTVFPSYYGKTRNLSNTNNPLQFNMEIRSLPKYLRERETSKVLHPLYIKKPNITLSSPKHGSNGSCHK